MLWKLVLVVINVVLDSTYLIDWRLEPGGNRNIFIEDSRNTNCRE